MFISVVGLIVLTVLTAFGVLRTADATLWTPETNFASWYMVGGLIIAFVHIQRIEPNDDIPDLQRMEQMIGIQPVWVLCRRRFSRFCALWFL